MNITDFETDLNILTELLLNQKKSSLGYSEDDILEVEHDLDLVFSSAIRYMYKKIGNESRFTQGKIDRIYDLSEIKRIEFIWQGTLYCGIEFAKNKNKLVYFGDIPYQKDKQNDIIQYRMTNDWMWSPFNSATSELFYILASNVRDNMNFVLSIKESDAVEVLQSLTKFCDLKEFQFFREEIASSVLDIKIFYSLENGILVICDSDAKNKITVSANDISRIKSLKSIYKSSWVKKGEEKINAKKRICNKALPTSFEEKLSTICNIAFNVKKKKQIIDKLSSEIQSLIPIEMISFYEIIASHDKILFGAYKLIEPESLMLTNGKVLFAEEEQGVCKYLVDFKEKSVYYVDAYTCVKEEITLTDFLLYITLLQGTASANTQGIVSKEENLEIYFDRFQVNSINVYFSLKLGIIGYDYNNESICLLSRNVRNMKKFELDSGIIIQYF